MWVYQQKKQVLGVQLWAKLKMFENSQNYKSLCFIQCSKSVNQTLQAKSVCAEYDGWRLWASGVPADVSLFSLGGESSTFALTASQFFSDQTTTMQMPHNLRIHN